MLKSILNLNGVNELTKVNQKKIHGGKGSNACFNTCDGACYAGTTDIFDYIDCSIDCLDLCDVAVLAP